MLRKVLRITERGNTSLPTADRGRGRGPQSLRQFQLVREERGADWPTKPTEESADTQVSGELNVTFFNMYCDLDGIIGVFVFLFYSSRVELKRLCEIFTRMFADPHSKVYVLHTAALLCGKIKL